MTNIERMTSGRVMKLLLEKKEELSLISLGIFLIPPKPFSILRRKQSY